MGHFEPTTDADTVERTLLIGIEPPNAASPREAIESLEELDRLAQTAGAEVVGSHHFRLRRFDAATCVPHSRVEAIAESTEEQEAHTVIFDLGLSPAQQRNLEQQLKRKVLDRQQLILDIFAGRAQSSEGKVQVELAQLKYLLPRLRGMWKHLERQAGGIGTRGPGEKQIESDKRKITERIARLEGQVKKIKRTRDTQRRRRQRNNVATVSLIGYTNAGKSTMLNALTESGVLAEDKLFATLDPTTRATNLPGGTLTTFTDTVGFINNLPTALAAAFRATLEEIGHADLLLQVVDATSSNIERDLATTAGVLQDLGLEDHPRLIVWNKIDALEDRIIAHTLEGSSTGAGGALSVAVPSVAASAHTGEGLDRVLVKIEEMLHTRACEVTLRLGHDQYDLLARLHKQARVDSVDYREDGIYVEAAMRATLATELDEYQV